MHLFSDASKYAYAAVVFNKMENDESLEVQLLQALSRVFARGKKVTTTVRLEVPTVIISSRLSSTILREIPHDEIYFGRILPSFSLVLRGKNPRKHS